MSIYSVYNQFNPESDNSYNWKRNPKNCLQFLMKKLDKNTSEQIISYMSKNVDLYAPEVDKMVLSAVRMLACVYDYSDVIAIINQIVDFKIYHNYFFNMPQLKNILESDKYKTFFKGIGDYGNLEKAGIMRGFPSNTRRPYETDKMRIEAIDRINDWRLVYAMRSLNDISVSEYHTTMKNLIQLFIDLYDNNMINSMMILGDCLMNHDKISRKSMKMKWWIEMKDYPDEFVRQAILTDRIGFNYDGYMKNANEIAAKFRSRRISSFYWAKLFKLNTDSYNYNTQEYTRTISSCSDAWIKRNNPIVAIINDNIMTYISNKPVAHMNGYNDFYRLAYVNLNLSRPPVANTLEQKMLSTDANMKYYAHIFKDANTACRFAAWEWMLIESVVLSPSLRAMYDEDDSRHDFPTSSYDANENAMLKALYDYIDNGIIPDSYEDAVVTPFMRELMNSVAEHDYANDDNKDDYSIQNVLKSMFSDANIFERNILELFM